jgi:hypothetical protein
MSNPVLNPPLDVTFDRDYAQIPVHMQEGIRRYVVQGRQPGSFLTAVITNDLKGAVFSADDTNLSLLPLYVRWFHNVPPAACQGSPATMREWMNARAQDTFNLP